MKYGYNDHKVSARINLNIGDIKKGSWFDKVGRDCSLVNNFRASAKGWGSPVILTLFGPFRFWK